MPDDFAGLPELTVSLRSLGSSRGAARAEQGRFFSALLDARRRAADARSMSEAIAAFNVARLGSALDDSLRTLAAERYPDRPPARRAFEAELVDGAQPLYAALRTLREVTPAAGTALNDALWQQWLAALRTAFEAADRAWRSIDASLGRVPPARKSTGGSELGSDGR